MRDDRQGQVKKNPLEISSCSPERCEEREKHRGESLGDKWAIVRSLDIGQQGFYYHILLYHTDKPPSAHSDGDFSALENARCTGFALVLFFILFEHYLPSIYLHKHLHGSYV